MALWYIAVSLILVAILVALASVASLIFVFCFRHHAGPMACDYCKYFIKLICKGMNGSTSQLVVYTPYILGYLKSFRKKILDLNWPDY